MRKSILFKKSISVLLLISMIGISLAGCSSGNKSTEGVDAEPKTELENGNQEAVEGEVTYPLQAKDKLSIWCGGPDVSGIQMKPNAAYKDYTESPFHTGLKEMTGVDVEWQFPSEGEDPTQAYNLLLTDETLPDMIFKAFAVGDAKLLIDDGVIYDLTEYLPKYAPDYWAYLQAEGNEDLDRNMKTEDGKYYGVGSFKEGDFNLTYAGPVVRKDWLEENNLEQPVTLEDWDKMLRLFKEKYNATLAFFNARMTPGFASGTNAYATFGAVLFIDDNGKIQLAQTQPEWKEYMETLAQWYKDGLIDKDVVTLDDAGLRTKVLNNEIGASFTAISQISNWQKDAADQGNGAEWIGVEYPRLKAGEPTNTIQTTGGRYYNYCAVVTTSCPEERLIEALQWLNYGFTKEGITYWNYGKEGESYTLDSSGVPQWTELLTKDQNGLSDALNKYTGVTGTGISIQAEYFVQTKNDKNAIDAVYKWIDNTEVYKHTLPNGLALTQEETIEVTDKMTAIRTRVEEMALKYFTGEESLDNFDKFVEELKGMGLQDVLDIQQAAYDRYMKR